MGRKEFFSCVEVFSGQVALVELDSIYLSLLGDRTRFPAKYAVHSSLSEEPSAMLLIPFNTSDIDTCCILCKSHRRFLILLRGNLVYIQPWTCIWGVVVTASIDSTYKFPLEWMCIDLVQYSSKKILPLVIATPEYSLSYKDVLQHHQRLLVLYFPRMYPDLLQVQKSTVASNIVVFITLQWI